MAKGLLAGWAPGDTLDTGRFNFRQPAGIGLQVAKRRDEEQRVVERDLRRLEDDWRRWVRAMFPGHVSDEDGDFVPFGKQHERFWDHLWSIRLGVRPDPSLYGWPRGQAKSTSMEMGTVALGARRIRPYGLYLCNLQDQANEHVTNVRDMISNSDGIARFYPELAARAVGKYGHSEGWNRTRLSTASGFTVDAIGLDTASGRGKKFKIHRPGFIIIDDIDDQADSPAAVVKKILALKNRILPTGSSDVAVIGGQNMVHPGSIFSHLFGVGDAAPGSGAASPIELDFLADRVTDGPIKAVEGLEYERLPPGRPEGFEDRARYLITAGEATWEGMDLAACQRIIDTEGISAFLEERQHEVNAPPGGMYDHIEFERCTYSEVPWAAIERGSVWVDPAVTNHDGSDSHAIQADALHADGRIFRLYSWEGRTSPEDSMRRAILKAVELGFEKVGVETDQGGDTWRSVFREAKKALVDEGLITQQQADRVAFDFGKAGAGHGSKVHRNSLMLSEYERGTFVHVIGTHNVLERALKRFPKTKPLDLADAAYWSWHDLDSGGGSPVTTGGDSAFGRVGSDTGWGRV